MNETDFDESQYPDNDIATEYEFDYTKAKTNRFVSSGESLEVVGLDELDMFNSLLETVHLLKSPANAARLERSISQYKAGKAVERNLIDRV